LTHDAIAAQGCFEREVLVRGDGALQAFEAESPRNGIRLFERLASMHQFAGERVRVEVRSARDRKLSHDRTFARTVCASGDGDASAPFSHGRRVFSRPRLPVWRAMPQTAHPLSFWLEEFASWCTVHRTP